MKILSAPQIRQADAYTIAHEQIASVDLMERAAKYCSEKMWLDCTLAKSVKIFCGLGNNGGDGLAIARILLENKISVTVFILSLPGKPSEDFMKNKIRLMNINVGAIKLILTKKDFPIVNANDVVVDCIFGTGLSKPVYGLAADCINHINKSKAKIISVDIPSGLFADEHSNSTSAIINAHETLSFQFPKLAFMFAENDKHVGDWKILDIGLHKGILKKLFVENNFLEKNFVKSLLKPRAKFSHKGNYGHALFVAGNYGKMGAAVLATKACLRSGVGLVTALLPEGKEDMMQIAAPEAMVINYDMEELKNKTFTAYGIGPGLGTGNNAKNVLQNILKELKTPTLFDADALNIISENKKMLKQVPANSILTPHQKEFERLTKKASDDFARHEIQIDFSKKYNVFVVLKGAHTCITTPSGECYFNSTGNPGMAKGGSGDVLTGIITGLLAQGYSPINASIIGVYVHGLAGDIAAEEKGQTGMIATDIIECLPKAFQNIAP